MRELGHRGGRSRRKGVAEQLPETERQSLREFLQDSLDHETIKGAVEQALASGNESARVACIRLLSDLELYRKDGEEDWRKQAREEMNAHAEEANEILLRLILGRAKDIVHAVLLEFERSLEDGKLMPDARRRMLDSLAAVSERVDYAGRVHATPEAARERGELDRQERERPVQSFRRTS